MGFEGLSAFPQPALGAFCALGRVSRDVARGELHPPAALSFLPLSPFHIVKVSVWQQVPLDGET